MDAQYCSLGTVTEKQTGTCGLHRPNFCQTTITFGHSPVMMKCKERWHPRHSVLASMICMPTALLLQHPWGRQQKYHPTLRTPVSRSSLKSKFHQGEVSIVNFLTPFWMSWSTHRQTHSPGSPIRFAYNPNTAGIVQRPPNPKNEPQKSENSKHEPDWLIAW